MRQVAHQFGVALATVQRWVARAGGQRLDRVDWTDRPCGLPAPVNRTERALEDLVLTIRQELRDPVTSVSSGPRPSTGSGSRAASPIRRRSAPSA
jgi:hypothetical protein